MPGKQKHRRGPAAARARGVNERKEESGEQSIPADAGCTHAGAQPRQEPRGKGLGCCEGSPGGGGKVLGPKREAESSGGGGEEVGGGGAAACSPSALSTAWLGLIFLM
ncbi:hypothetical protein K0M31_010183 [Melipona bicolor]|uniref:Uncharacterized protein n=1 Tax=Melipona bicolor TaxID=60889 RepID=A0AA40KIY0_9HYME|nr:hypothetical protein K0M31_010183 [Melipona bicolor]